MKILIIHLGTLSQIIPATSIIKGILKKIENPFITWTTWNKKDTYIFKYNTDIERIISFNQLKELDETFDILINLFPRFPHEKCKKVKIKNALDYEFDKQFKKFADILIGEKIISNMNIFQVYYKLSGLTWKGEGYSLNYSPKSRTKHHRIGLGVAHANLRNYVNEHLKLKSNKIWHIPYKKNIFKRMDEINRCYKIVTDDLLTFHLAMALRKYVYFLETYPLNIKLELFGKGEIHKIPKRILQ